MSTVHQSPANGSGLTVCCKRPPLELPRGDRITITGPVTCAGALRDVGLQGATGAGCNVITDLGQCILEAGHTPVLGAAGARRAHPLAPGHAFPPAPYLRPDVPIPSPFDQPDAYLGRLVDYHEQQVLALRRLAAELGVELPGTLTVWRPWRLEPVPGVHQSVMLPAGATISHVSSSTPWATKEAGVLLWLEVPLVSDPAVFPTHRYVELATDDARPPVGTESWLGDVLLYGHDPDPWTGTVFRCYLIDA